MRHYLDLTEPNAEEAHDLQSVVVIQFHACVCLATLFSICSALNNLTISTMPLHDAGSTVPNRLADSLRVVEIYR